MKPSERTGLIALVVFFFLAVVIIPILVAAHSTLGFVFGIIGLALVASAFTLFAIYLQHREEAP